MTIRSRRTCFALAAILVLASAGANASDLAGGDAAWERRAEGEVDGRPSRIPILESVEAYERELAASPDSLEARWKLLRSLHFAGDFASNEERDRLAIFERARDVSEEGLDRLAARANSGERLESLDAALLVTRVAGVGLANHDVARLYFWSAINWGAWSRTVGLVSAVRRGSANRLYRYTQVALDLEPGYDEGGALRLMGSLHAELPRVPFVSPWVDRDQALPLMERAHALAPANPGNRLLLALALLELAPDRQAEAVELLERVADLEPRTTMRIEDLAMREQARERLAGETT